MAVDVMITSPDIYDGIQSFLNFSNARLIILSTRLIILKICLIMERSTYKLSRERSTYYFSTWIIISNDRVIIFKWRSTYHLETRLIISKVVNRALEIGK